MADALIEPISPRILAEDLFKQQCFWISGVTGVLHLPRRISTGQFIHPFWNVDERDPDIERAPVSGRGSVFTYTVNLQTYNPAVKPPYVIAIIQLEEQEDLRIVTNIIGCDPPEVFIGMRVKVVFEPNGELYVPLFIPDRD